MSGHTPGALRAAKEIVEATQELMPDTILRTANMIDKTAAVIDRETAAPELLAELKQVLSWAKTEKAPLRDQEIKSIEAVIAKARGKQ